MTRLCLFHAFVPTWLLLILLTGCHRQESRVDVPAYDPASIAAGAMTAHDTNGDGAVADDELAKAGSLRDHPDLTTPVIDKNADGRVSKEEVQARAQQWLERNTGLQSFQVTVNQGGSPLAGAMVKLVPEPFMNGAVPAAVGTTDERGSAILGVADSELPGNLAGRKFVKPGFYKIEITHPTTSIPAKYNTETILGQEISDDAIGSVNFVYDVK